MRKTRKIIMIGAILVAIAFVATASLIPFFGMVQTTATVTQSVMIDGHPYNDPIVHEVQAVGGCCYCWAHTICNEGCEPVLLDWSHTASPDMQGIKVLIYESPCCERMYECDCDCDEPPIDWPILLDPGQCLRICYCLHFDVMIKPGTYVISSKLIPLPL